MLSRLSILKSILNKMALVSASDKTGSAKSCGPFFCYTLSLGISNPTSFFPLTTVCPSWLRLTMLGGFCEGASLPDIISKYLNTAAIAVFGLSFVLVLVKYMDISM
jgi:hypothetical protein